MGQVDREILDQRQEIDPDQSEAQIIGIEFLQCQLPGFQSGLMAYYELAMALVAFTGSLLLLLLDLTR